MPTSVAWGELSSHPGWPFPQTAGLHFLGVGWLRTQIQWDWRAGEGQKYALGWRCTGGKALRCSWTRAPLEICKMVTWSNGKLGQENPNCEVNARRTANLLHQSLGNRGCYVAPMEMNCGSEPRLRSPGLFLLLLKYHQPCGTDIACLWPGMSGVVPPQVGAFLTVSCVETSRFKCWCSDLCLSERVLPRCHEFRKVGSSKTRTLKLNLADCKSIAPVR